MHARAISVSLLLLLGAWPNHVQEQVPGKNALLVRGKEQAIYYFPGTREGRSEPKPIILFACGDGGWRGFAITTAETMASWGYDTVGLDSKAYLESFTGKTMLKESEVNSDFRTLMKWTRGQSARPVILVGWSEGAGLALLGAAGEENRDLVLGLVAIGLPDRSLLAWRWSDAVTWITRRDPDEPGFVSALHLPRVAPLPMVMINSSQDEYQSQETYQRLYALAREPKKSITIDAQNHRFDGNHEAFFNALRGGLQWIEQASTPKAASR